jgi:hypothetical protein
MNPPGIESRRIVRAIVDDAKRAFYTGAVTVNWAADENYQWDLPDGSGRFYVPDIVFIHPGATTAEEERTATLFGLAEGWQRYQMAADGAYGEEIHLPAPLNFSLTTAGWPRWK